MQTPYAGLKVTAGSVAQTFTQTVAKITCFSANTGGGVVQIGSNLEGDAAVVPDVTNNYLRLNAPGLYILSIGFTIAGGGAGDFLIQVRKGIVGVMTVQPDLTCGFTCGSSGLVNASIEAPLLVNKGDQQGNLAMWPPPSGIFAGAGGWPQSQTTIDLVATVATGSVPFTIQYATFCARKAA